MRGCLGLLVWVWLMIPAGLFALFSTFQLVYQLIESMSNGESFVVQANTSRGLLLGWIGVIVAYWLVRLIADIGYDDKRYLGPIRYW